MKYRYERDINVPKRNILQLISEGDATCGCYMVLCVTRILNWGEYQNENVEITETFATIEVTDGWYCMRALLDSKLTEYLVSGKIFPGKKNFFFF